MLGYHGFGANPSSDAKPSPRLQPSLKLRLDKTAWQASDEQNNCELRVDVEIVKALRWSHVLLWGFEGKMT
jgi:hypothetical protein